MFSLDRASPVPLATQIEQQLIQLLQRGRLAPGVRLPSIRHLAQQLGVSPNTVVNAYDRLVADGHVEARSTAGYFAAASGSTQPDVASLIEAGVEQDAIWLVQQANDLPPGMLQASSGALPPAWLQEAAPASVLQRAFASLPGDMATRCPPQGWVPLRERLALMLRGHGIAVDTSRVLTTTGATQAIDLICRAYLNPGDAVVVEDPVYHLLIARLNDSGVRIVRVPRLPEGMDLARLEQALVEHRPRLMFVQGSVHNPTGWTSTPGNLHRVLSLAEKHGVLIAEDDVYGHLLPGQRTSMAQLSGLDRVIYFSSFCKVLSPALRVGYIVADPALLKPLLRQKIMSVMTSSSLVEAVTTELLAAGRVRKHVERLQARLAGARSACLQVLQDVGVRFEQPAQAGMFLWGRLPEGVAVEPLVKDAWQQGILLAGSATFGSEATSAGCLRFNVVYAQNVQLSRYLKERFALLEHTRNSLARIAQG